MTIKNPMKLQAYISSCSGNIQVNNLITAVSYEERCFLSVKSLVDSFDIQNVILILFKNQYLNFELKQKWDYQKKLLYDLFNEHNINVVNIECDPVYFKDSLEQIGFALTEGNHNIINITTLPKNYIVRFAKEFDRQGNAFYYYKSNYRKPSQIELEIAIEKNIPIEGFEGIRELNAEDLLVLLLGYEGNRALSFVSNFSPYKILPLISLPEESENIDSFFYNNVKECNRFLLQKHSVIKKSEGRFYTVSSFDHLSFFNQLKDIMEIYKREGIDICISSLSTKPQMLGIYLYWRENKDTQLIYSVLSKRFDLTSNEKNEKLPFYISNKEDNGWIYILPNFENSV